MVVVGIMEVALMLLVAVLDMVMAVNCDDISGNVGYGGVGGIVMVSVVSMEVVVVADDEEGIGRGGGDGLVVKLVVAA